MQGNSLLGGAAAGTIPPPASIVAQASPAKSAIPHATEVRRARAHYRARTCVSYPEGERGWPIKPGRCATHSEMPTTAVADSGDRSRSA